MNVEQSTRYLFGTDIVDAGPRDTLGPVGAALDDPAPPSEMDAWLAGFYCGFMATAVAGSIVLAYLMR